MRLGGEPTPQEPPKNDKTRNAYKKLVGLKARRAPVFWALGPDGYSLVFRVGYQDDGRVSFKPAAQDVLDYRG